MLFTKPSPTNLRTSRTTRASRTIRAYQIVVISLVVVKKALVLKAASTQPKAGPRASSPICGREALANVQRQVPVSAKKSRKRGVIEMPPSRTSIGTMEAEAGTASRTRKGKPMLSHDGSPKCRPKNLQRFHAQVLSCNRLTSRSAWQLQVAGRRSIGCCHVWPPCWQPTVNLRRPPNLGAYGRAVRFWRLHPGE